jgi:hypothetical protein
MHACIIGSFKFSLSITDGKKYTKANGNEQPFFLMLHQLSLLQWLMKFMQKMYLFHSTICLYAVGGLEH